MATYTQPTDPALLNPAVLAADLRAEVERASLYFASLDEATASQPLAPGKWCTRLTVGHLIDSAGNNLQRIVRLGIDESLDLPGYRQNEWVAVQRYDLRPWAEIRELWRALNLHLAHVIAQIDPAHLTRVWHFSEGDVTLGFIVEDYIAHLRHHLNALPEYSAQ